MNNIQLLIGRGSTFKDCTELVNRITFSGRKGAAPRTLEVVLLDSEGYSHGRSGVDCSSGQLAIFLVNGKEVFRGLIMTDNAGNGRTVKFKAYDNCVYLSNNKDSFSYKKKRADQIFKDCLKKLGLKAGSVKKTKHKISEITKKGTTYWDVIQEALSQTYKATGRRYYVSSSGGKISLLQRKAKTSMKVFDTDTGISDYERSRSIENTRTRVKMTTSKDKTKKTWKDKSLEKKIGRFQDVVSVDEKVTATELKKQLATFKEEKAVVSQSLKITGEGDISLRAGGCIYAKIPGIDTEQIMYIDEDTHVFENGSHKMTLKLNYKADFKTKSSSGSKKKKSSSKKKYKVTASALNLRKSPNGTIIGTMPCGTVVTYAGKTSGGWVYVSYGSKKGYAYKQYLKEV